MTFKTVEEAINLVKKKKNINFEVYQCSMENDLGEAIGFSGVAVPIRREPELRLELVVKTPHGDWEEETKLHYCIFGSDLRDGSIVDKIIGGDMSEYSTNKKEILRLAFIIYDGIRYGIHREVRKSDIDAGWRSRVTEIKMVY